MMAHAQKPEFVLLRLKCDGTCAETRFRLTAFEIWWHMRRNQISSFRRNVRVHLNRQGASVQSTTGSRVVGISGSNAGYTIFRGSVKSTGYPLHSPVSSSLPPLLRHRTPSHFNWTVPNMQCACAVLYCHLCHAPLCSIFSTLSHKRHDFRKKITEHKMCVLIFCTTFVWNICHYKKNSTRYDILLTVHLSIIYFSLFPTWYTIFPSTYNICYPLSSTCFRPHRPIIRRSKLYMQPVVFSPSADVFVLRPLSPLSTAARQRHLQRGRIP